MNKDYAFYSRVLGMVFESLDDLKRAEAKHFDELKAKEDKAATRKADAAKVEAAFKAMNAARKTYKENLAQLTTEYTQAMANTKKAFEAGKADIQSMLAAAEEAYAKELKNFTDKHDQYHLTLKDGDFETTISSKSTDKPNTETADEDATDIIDFIKSFAQLLAMG